MRGLRWLACSVAVGVLAAGAVGCSAKSGDRVSVSGQSHGEVTVQEMIQCFRQHGLPDYPDAQFDPNDGRWHLPDHRPDLPPSVQQACASVLPQVTQGPAVPNAEFQQLVRFAACMRQHGFPNWPDPGIDGVFALPGQIIDSAGRQLKTKMGTCEKDLPDGRYPQIRHA